MGNTQGSYLGSSGDGLGSIGRGGTSNQTTGPIQAQRDRQRRRQSGVIAMPAQMENNQSTESGPDAPDPVESMFKAAEKPNTRRRLYEGSGSTLSGAQRNDAIRRMIAQTYLPMMSMRYTGDAARETMKKRLEERTRRRISAYTNSSTLGGG